MFLGIKQKKREKNIYIQKVYGKSLHVHMKMPKSAPEMHPDNDEVALCSVMQNIVYK